jgi:hypothetical protein
MSIPIDLDELLVAYEWVSAGEAAGVDAEAYISRIDGQIHCFGEGIDEAAGDITDESLFVAVPHKSELDLGRSLALRFIEEASSSVSRRGRRVLSQARRIFALQVAA